MGGYGSGRWQWHARATTVEECRRIPITLLREALEHGPPYSGRIWWTLGDQPSGDISYRLEERNGRLVMRLLYRITDKETKDYDYPVFLQTTHPHFGGLRYWFTCPLSVDGVRCGRRVAILYSPPNAEYFGCRHCYRLTYTSSQEAHQWDRFYARMAGDIGMSFRDTKAIMRQLEQRNK
jgi:hypothetical protein